ncbi:MAG TPA: ABC transporter transmembrane domain-containing protein, partial [Terracidiphilus sp.]|nr:ABC transporter transmembrane domain-containing protein [Terracidiphilus sp.]
MLRDLSPLFRYMGRYRWGYAWGTFACVCTNAIWVQFPRVLQSAINDLKSGTTLHHITLLALLLIAISLGKGVFLYIQRWVLICISRDIEFDLRNDLFQCLERQDTGFYQRYRTGDLMARMTNDLNAVRMV